MLCRLKQLNKQEGGFTLIELIIGVVLASLIGIAVAMTLVLMFKVSADSSHRVTAIRQVQNAGMWITQDVQSAQTITIGGSHFLEVLWADWGGTKNKVDYDYDPLVTSDLTRKYYIKHIADTDYVITSQTVVAHYIDSSMDTSINPQKAKTRVEQSGGIYTLTVTATITGFSANGQPISETRTYEILSRSSG
jgi:type II secretory pathway pseudopilin PulG